MAVLAGFKVRLKTKKSAHWRMPPHMLFKETVRADKVKAWIKVLEWSANNRLFFVSQMPKRARRHISAKILKVPSRKKINARKDKPE